MRTIVIILGFVLAFSLLSNGWQWVAKQRMKVRHKETAHQIRKANKELQYERDLNHELEAKNEALRAAMVLQVSDLRDSLKWQQIQTSQWKSNYVKAKNSRVDRGISDAGLDSLVTGFLTGR